MSEKMREMTRRRRRHILIVVWKMDVPKINSFKLQPHKTRKKSLNDINNLLKNMRSNTVLEKLNF